MNVMSLLEPALTVALFAAGAYMLWTGGRAWVNGGRQTGGPLGKAIDMVRGFRFAIIGLTVIGVGVWLLTGQTWVLILSLAVAAEELAETTFIISVLRSDPRLRDSSGNSSRSPRQSAPAG